MNLPQCIDQRLQELGMTQKWLAYKTNITPAKINLILKGKRELKIQEYLWICWALKIEPGEILKAEPPPAKC
jgi:DNA-binding Xre family transcriptional regulator